MKKKWRYFVVIGREGKVSAGVIDIEDLKRKAEESVRNAINDSERL